MLDKSYGLFFFLKRPQDYVRGEMYIYLRITVNGVSKDLSTKRSWDPARWDAKAGKAIGTKEDAKTLNMLLVTLESKAHEARRSLIDDDRIVTAQSIKDLLMGVESRRMVLKIFEQHNERIRALVPEEYSAGTLDLFERTLAHTRAFIKWKYGLEDMDIKNLGFEFVSEFAFWLKSTRKCQHNSAMKYLTYFKKIVLMCVKSKWLAGDPFIDFRMTRRETERPHLSAEELRAIYEKRFSTERLTQVRDIFVFSCYTGLAYADVQKLKQTEVVIGVDKEKWICTTRQKTDSPSRIPLMPVALAIIEKYKENPACLNKGSVLPVLSNQKMNAYLKEIADICGVNKNLSFHIARHTFATTVTLSNGVPIESVAKMLGHRNLRQTQHYAKVLDTKVGDDMQQLKRKLRAMEDPASVLHG